MTATPSITVYSKPHCVQCDATKRKLHKAGLTPYATAEEAAQSPGGYHLVDITEDAQALQKIKDMGFLEAPVVVWVDASGTVHSWSKFRINEINAAIAGVKAAA